MTACEKCWDDAHGDPDKYHELVESRNCTPEEQAGRDATVCPRCKRRTIHQYAGYCMTSECIKIESRGRATT